MVKLSGVISQISSSRVMVVGDLLLDAYTIGKARRISPEAPVAVVNVSHEEHLPGGAGNVMLNLVSLGAQVIAIGRIGQDGAGEKLRNALSAEGIDTRGIIEQADFPTPVKNRIIAENQQIVRIDHEKIMPIPQQLEESVIQSLPNFLEGVSVVAISDYGKGFLSRKLLSAVMSLCKQRGITIIADPKGLDFSKYEGATVIKPNLGEAYAAANMPHDAPLEIVADRVLQITNSETLMVTRSEAGISLFHRNGLRDDFPVKVREVKDVTGAGDTVLAMLTCALASGLSIITAAQLSNVAAGIAIERLGCARVSLSDLSRRLLEDDIGNKVFDGEHLFALQHAIKDKRISLLSLDSTLGLTTAVFKAIRKLTQETHCDLLIYVRDKEPCEDFVNLLASLREVNFILLQNESLKHLCRLIQPQEVCILDENQTMQEANLQDLLLFNGNH